MSPLEWWAHSRYIRGAVVEDEACLFNGSSKGVALLVEGQDEYDLASALQLIYGGSVTVIDYNKSDKDWLDYLDRFPRVYTSWDPFDRNRL